MLQTKFITVSEALKQDSEIIAYSHAYQKELLKKGSLYCVEIDGQNVLKSTSIEEAVNEYNLNY